MLSTDHFEYTVCTLIFAGFIISRICNFRSFYNCKIAGAGYSGVEIFMGEISNS